MKSDITLSLLILDIDVLKWKYSMFLWKIILQDKTFYVLISSTFYKKAGRLFSRIRENSLLVSVPSRFDQKAWWLLSTSSLVWWADVVHLKHCEETLLVLLNIMVSRSNRLPNANVALRYVNTEKLNVKSPEHKQSLQKLSWCSSELLMIQ